MKNLYAYTETINDFPGFLSVNETDDGTYVVTVRRTGNGGRDLGSLEMTRAQMDDFITKVALKLNEGPFKPL
jgi:hypothetical protein